MRIRAEYEASIHAANITYAMKITQKARFSGVCFLFCGQSTRLQDGFDPGMRVNLTTVISPTLQPSTAVEELLGGATSPRYRKTSCNRESPEEPALSGFPA